MEWWIGGLVLAGLTGAAWIVGRNFGGQVQVERARELFRLQRERLEAQFMRAAAATGKPRGLLWKDCQWDNPVIFVREKKSLQIAALVGVTIQFEAVKGGDMEGVQAVGNLRTASAVFFFQKGSWMTVGRAVFNMNPQEALEHFRDQYERIVQ